jgi:hypothetical protein
MAAKRHKRESTADEILRPFAGWLLGPGAWVAHDSLSSLLVSWDRHGGMGWMLHLTTLVLLAVAAAGALISWRSFNRSRRSNGSDEGTRSRRSLALIGSVIAALSFLGILMEAAGAGIHLSLWRRRL